MVNNQKPENPWGLLLFGQFVFAIGALGLYAFGDGLAAAPGLIVLGVGSAMSLVGIVGVGVEMGMARHEWTHRR